MMKKVPCQLKLYSVKCPECEVPRLVSYEAMRWAKKHGGYCTKHSQAGERNSNFGKRGKDASAFGLKHTQAVKNAQSLLMKGIPKTEEQRKRMSEAAKARMRNPEIRERLRNIMLDRVELMGGETSHNSLATKCLGAMDKRMGWNGRYAGHPDGEMRVAGYKVDYYAEITMDGEPIMLIIEWDEPHHKYQLNEDIDRQAIIEERLGSRCIFLRFHQDLQDFYSIADLNS